MAGGKRELLYKDIRIEASESQKEERAVIELDKARVRGRGRRVFEKKRGAHEAVRVAGIARYRS